MTKHTTRMKFWPILITLLILVGAAAGYLYLRTHNTSPPVEKAQAAYKTSTIQKNSLTQSATGTGKIIASQSVDLSFPTSGTIAELDVQLGDKVEAGQILARLDGTKTLEQDTSNAQLDLQIAQQNLADLKTNGITVVAKLLANQASAQSALMEAQKNLRDPHVGRCDKDTLAKYYQKYLDAVVAARPWQALLKQETANGQDLQYSQMNLAPILRDMRYADLNYQYCLSYTPDEVRASKAVLELAQATFDHARADYKSAVSNHGINPIELAVAEAAVKNVQMKLTEAQKNLANATLSAPISGTITTLNGEAGGGTPTGTLITVSNLAHTQLLVTMDETDMASFALGCKANVTLNGIPNPLTGQVTEVYPQLTSSRESSSVQGIVSIDAIPTSLTLPLGLSGSVDTICDADAQALTIPLQALKQSGRSDVYYVYVLNNQGQPEKREVKLGIQTANLLEVKNGLSEGEKVITNPENLP